MAFGRILALCFVGTLGLALAPFGAPPQFQGGTSTLDPPCMPIFAKVTFASEENGVVNVSWASAGRHKLPKGERGIDGKAVRYTYLGCFATFKPADVSMTQADAKKVTTAEAWKRLKVGTVVLVSMDGSEIAKEFLAQVKADTMVLKVEGISLTESSGDE
jgi:hypothetical protein